MLIHQIPRIVPTLLPKLIWSNPVGEKNNAVYFTFDDGPTPEVTEWTLDQLKQFDSMMRKIELLTNNVKVFGIYKKGKLVKG